MEEEENQRMEDFVRELFTKTEDFNLLTKKIVRKKYLQHTKKDSLTPQQKSLFADIIVKLLFEFNVGTEKPTNQNANELGTSPAVPEETSDISVDGSKGKSPTGISENPQNTRSAPMPVSCPKTKNEISQDTCVAKNKKLEKKEEKMDVEKGENQVVKSGKKKSGLSENEKKPTSKETNNKKKLFFSLQPTRRVLARQILINNFRDKVKNSPSKIISNEPSPLTNNNTHSDTATSEQPLPNLSEKPTDEEFKKEAQNEPVSVNSDGLPRAEKQQTTALKRLSAFEVLQSVLEDSNDGSVLSKSDSADEDQSSVARSSPVCDSPGNKVNSLIPLEDISDSTPTQRPRRSTKRLLVSDNDSTMDGFTPPSKVKRIITSDSDSKNSPIRMRLFRNRIVDYSLHAPNATKNYLSDSNSEIQSPVKLVSLPGLSSSDTSPIPLKIKKSSLKKNKALNHSNSTNEIKERKTVKPFRISISKKEILRASDSESDAERSPVIKRKKTKPKPKRIKKKTSKHKARNNHAASSSSSCDTDDLKLSQIKSMNQVKRDESSDSDSDLLINYASNRFKEKNNFKIPAAQKIPRAVDGTPPKVRIIHEKSAMDSDSDFNPKKPKSSQSNANVGKVLIIRENAVNSENDCTASKNICDNAPSSNTEKTPQKNSSKKSKSKSAAQILNSDSDDSDLGLRIVLSNSSDSEDMPLARKRNESEISLPSLTQSTSTSASDDAQKITVGNKTYSPKVSSDNFHVFGGDMLTKDQLIEQTMGYIKRIQQTGSSHWKDRQESTANSSSHVDVEDSSEESDNESLQTNRRNNSVYSEDELYRKNLENKRLVVRLERIQADASLLINPNPPSENFDIMAFNSQTTTSDDEGRLEIDCNGVSSDSDISSHSEPMPINHQPSTITNHVVKEITELKAVPFESDKLKRLKKICRTAELYVKYKKEFEHLQSDAAKCQRLQQILKNAGMQGKPSFKAAERLRLLKEAKELSETNIISSNSAGRTRRKMPDIFTDKTPNNTIDSKPEKFVNLAGVVDSEGSENDMELN